MQPGKIKIISIVCACVCTLLRCLCYKYVLLSLYQVLKLSMLLQYYQTKAISKVVLQSILSVCSIMSYQYNIPGPMQLLFLEKTHKIEKYFDITNTGSKYSSPYKPKYFYI